VTPRRVTVVGAGVIGLSIAHEIAGQGDLVTVVADRSAADSVSAVAAAVWFPYRTGASTSMSAWLAPLAGPLRRTRGRRDQRRRPPGGDGGGAGPRCGPVLDGRGPRRPRRAPGRVADGCAGRGPGDGAGHHRLVVPALAAGPVRPSGRPLRPPHRRVDRRTRAPGGPRGGRGGAALGRVAGRRRTVPHPRPGRASGQPRHHLSRAVGLRPGRDRVRLEPVGGHAVPVVACYGHGGAGVTLSWGCAEEVARLSRAG
jgi:hypothetical protein